MDEILLAINNCFYPIRVFTWTLFSDRYIKGEKQIIEIAFCCIHSVSSLENQDALGIILSINT